MLNLLKYLLLTSIKVKTNPYIVCVNPLKQHRHSACCSRTPPYFPIKLLPRETPGALSTTLKCFSKGPSPANGVPPLPRVLTAVLLIGIVLAVLLAIALRILFADAVPVAAFVGVILAGDGCLDRWTKGEGLNPALRSPLRLPHIPRTSPTRQKTHIRMRKPGRSRVCPHRCSCPRRSRPRSRPCRRISARPGCTSRCRT